MKLVQDEVEVRKGIRRFNEDIEELAPRLAYNRAWYYAPELDLVGPSKFIGYVGMTARRYLDSGALDGKQTEPALQQWFRRLEEGTPEEALVRSKVEQLLARHGKALNRAVRFCGPIGWKASGNETSAPSRDARVQKGRRTVHATITRGEALYVAECEQLAVVTQGRTIDETIANLKEAVELHLEGEDLEALGLAPDPVVLVTMELQPWAA